MQTTPEDNDELSAELFDRSSGVVDLVAPQIEAWVSGLFAAWDNDGAAIRFIEHCLNARGPVAALLCRAIAELGSGSVAAAGAAAASKLSNDLPDHGADIGRSRALAAWRVSAPFGHSVMIGFRVLDSPAIEVTDHSVLVEIGPDGGLEDLRLSGPPYELLPDASHDDTNIADRGTAALTVQELGVVPAAQAILEAWRLSAQGPRVFEETVGSNEQFVRRRLETILGVEVPPLRPVEPETDLRRGMSESEFAEANRAALATLQAAIGELDPPEAMSAAHDAWVSVIGGAVEGSTLNEAEALLYLEWADWLGVGIGLTRAGPGVAIDGSSMVEMVNRCPEVSSTIDAADREYTEKAFEVAIEHLAEFGVIADGQLTATGHQALLAAMIVAWSPVDSSQAD